MTFKTAMWTWAAILGVLFFAITSKNTASVASTPAAVRSTVATKAPPKKLSPVEECANLQLIIDRSLSITQAFDICETGKPIETWLAVRESNREKDPTYRAVRDGVRDALRR